MVHALIHACVVVVLIAAYVVLTLSGSDGTALLGVLGGYLAAPTVERVANGVSKKVNGR